MRLTWRSSESRVGFGAIAILEEVRVARRVAKRAVASLGERRLARRSAACTGSAGADARRRPRATAPIEELVAEAAGDAGGDRAEVDRSGGASPSSCLRRGED